MKFHSRSGPFRHCSWNSSGADGTFLSGGQSTWVVQSFRTADAVRLLEASAQKSWNGTSTRSAQIQGRKNRPSLSPLTGFPGKESSCSARDSGDVGLIPGSGRSPGGGHGKPLQYSCLENPMDRGAWWATVHGVAKSHTWLKRLSMHVHCPSIWKESLLIVFVDNLPQPE